MTALPAPTGNSEVAIHLNCCRKVGGEVSREGAKRYRFFEGLDSCSRSCFIAHASLSEKTFSCKAAKAES
jgi:hypothetical protein